MQRYSRASFGLLLCLGLTLLPACAGPGRSDAAGARGADQVDIRAAVLLDARSGGAVDLDAVVAACADADVVLIGENHGHPLGLALATAIWERLLARSPDAALSLEFFERDEQSRLDDYLDGLADEATFRTRTGRTKGNYPDGHRAMVEAAKRGERRVIAANAPRSYVRLARTDGFGRLERLTPEQQRLIRIPSELAGGRYREEFDKLMNGMLGDKETGKVEPETLEGMFRAQSLWDWTMADSIARALAEGERPVLHVVGRFHSDFDGGLVYALQKLRPSTRVVNISMVNESAAALREQDRGRGDFVAYVGPGPEKR